jgi:hypothetical protein
MFTDTIEMKTGKKEFLRRETHRFLLNSARCHKDGQYTNKLIQLLNLNFTNIYLLLLMKYLNSKYYNSQFSFYMDSLKQYKHCKKNTSTIIIMFLMPQYLLRLI